MSGSIPVDTDAVLKAWMLKMMHHPRIELGSFAFLSVDGQICLINEKKTKKRGYESRNDCGTKPEGYRADAVQT